MYRYIFKGFRFIYFLRSA